jgi:hypothetical protein
VAAIPTQPQVLLSVVVYQSYTRLSLLATEIAEARRINSTSTEKLIKKAKQITLWLQALDYQEFLSIEQIDKIKYALVHIAEVNTHGTAPLLNTVPRPDILIGGGGVTNITNNTYEAGIPFVNNDIDLGTEDVISIPVSSGNGVVVHYVVTNGTAYRAGQLTAPFNSVATDCNEVSSPDIGGSTDDVTLSVSIELGSFKMTATALSDNWSVSGKYYIIS